MSTSILAFPVWELELARVNAAGMLAVGGDGPPLQFEARDVIAAGGALRIGRRGEAWTARVPFEAVAITDVGVSPTAPSDLRLEVAGAETGRARLSGHALFRNIFPPGPHQRPPGESGLEVDARWANFGGALSGLDASWRPEGALAKHLDGDSARHDRRALQRAGRVAAGRSGAGAGLGPGRARHGRSVTGVRRRRHRLDARSVVAATLGRAPVRALSRHGAPLADVRGDRRRDSRCRSAPRSPARPLRSPPLPAPGRKDRTGRGRERHAVRLRRRDRSRGRDPAARRSAGRLDRPDRPGRRAGGVRSAGARADPDRPGRAQAGALRGRRARHPGGRGAGGLDPRATR